MTTRHCIFSSIAAGMLTLLLISCGSAPTRIYTLYPVAPAAMTPYAGPPIRVDAVHVPPALDRIEVVGDIAPGELKVSDLDHWSAPLAEIAKQVLSADMVARLPPGRAIFPHLAKPEDALGVSVDILDFRADANGPYLEASWSITATDPRTAPRRGAAQFRAKGSNTGATATANALSALIAQLADRIAADLPHEP
ncbi:MAG TPA: PqiC family protein [Steroidobacteraceae bacterium]|jgi:uncharacterized lipoprotein YmbA|nr:PqiC family protein [Steroidobacteraceae bacterium]